MVREFPLCNSASTNSSRLGVLQQMFENPQAIPCSPSNTCARSTGGSRADPNVCLGYAYASEPARVFTLSEITPPPGVAAALVRLERT